MTLRGLMLPPMWSNSWPACMTRQHRSEQHMSTTRNHGPLLHSSYKGTPAPAANPSARYHKHLQPADYRSYLNFQWCLLCRVREAPPFILTTALACCHSMLLMPTVLLSSARLNHYDLITKQQVSAWEPPTTATRNPPRSPRLSPPATHQLCLRC